MLPLPSGEGIEGRGNGFCDTVGGREERGHGMTTGDRTGAWRRLLYRAAALSTLAMPAILATLAGTAGAGTDPQTCERCHDEYEDHPVLAIYQTPHATLADERTGFGEQGCTSCHGDVEDHLDDRAMPPEITFDAETTPAEEQNRACLNCHEQDADRAHWETGTHAFNEVACVSCHDVHTERDTVLHSGGQLEVCSDCHQRERHQMRLPSRHPVDDGQMECTACHEPHGSSAEAELNRPSRNETCLECHAGKRGPFLWEHNPVQEDCTTCHEPHGSPHDGMLQVRSPQLCQDCHMGSHSGDGFGGGDLDDFRMRGQNCLNCHDRIHGSNHPRGGYFER